MERKMNTLQEQLLEAIGEFKGSLRALSVQAEVPYASLHGFVNDDSGISLTSASKLAWVLKLTLKRRYKRDEGTN